MSVAKYIWLMDKGFTISVEFKGVQCSFEGRISTMGYTHKIAVDINGLQVIYEPDEERNYRAILAEADQGRVRRADVELIALVGKAIESVHQHP